MRTAVRSAADRGSTDAQHFAAGSNLMLAMVVGSIAFKLFMLLVIKIKKLMANNDPPAAETRAAADSWRNTDAAGRRSQLIHDLRGQGYGLERGQGQLTVCHLALANMSQCRI